MDLLNFDPTVFFSFLLVFMRLSLILFVLPFFGGNSLPMAVKPAMCMVLALALWPHLKLSGVILPGDIWTIGIMVVGEIILGLTLNLLIRVIFSAIECGGELISFQMGFSMVNVIDPLTGASESATGHFMSMICMLTFLSLNGHLHILDSLARSFALVPPGGLLISPALTRSVLEFSGQIFVLAIKIAAPATVAVFLVDLALALIARAAPQMNILFIGFPLKISVGFLFLGMIFTLMARYVGEFVVRLGPLIDQTLKIAS